MVAASREGISLPAGVDVPATKLHPANEERASVQAPSCPSSTKDDDWGTSARTQAKGPSGKDLLTIATTPNVV